MTGNSSDKQLETLLDAAEAAILAAPADDVDALAANSHARAIVGGVLRVYGFEADGSRRPRVWRRSRDGRRMISAATRPPVGVPQEGMRATFDDGAGRGTENDDDDPS